jgi:GntR family transcriptional repressor for pyruvate dehydrogenase complex
MEDPASNAPAGGGRSIRSLDLLASKASRHSIVHDVRQQLINLISSGEVKVNDQLPSEMKLARLFGVCRPVVREAIVSLNALGLTRSLNGRGTFVASTTMRAPLLLGGYPPKHLNEIRRLLEIPAARLAALRRTDADVAHLREILARIDREEEADRRNKIDAEFHVGVAAVTGNPLLMKLISDIRNGVEDESLAVSVVVNRRAGARAEHLAIVDAIAQQDGEAAAAAMCAHLDAIDQSLILLAPSNASTT